MNSVPRKYIAAAVAVAAQVAAAAAWGLVGAITVLGVLVVALCTLVLMLRWDIRRASNRTRELVQRTAEAAARESQEARDAIQAQSTALREQERTLEVLLSSSGRARQDAELREEANREEQRKLSAAIQRLSTRQDEHREAVVESFEALSRAGKKSHDESLDLLKGLQRRLEHEKERWQGRSDELVRHVEAIVNLHELLDVRADMPHSGGWALRPEVLLAAVGFVLNHQARSIVECGSGTSSVWLGYAAEVVGRGAKVIALEHDPHFADATRRRVREHGLEAFVEVRDAPLVEQEVEGERRLWYGQEAWATLSDVDLLMVDGPPARTQQLARYPALPLLRPRLAPGAHILLDDADRPDEKEAMERWLATFPDLRLTDLVATKHAVMLSIVEDEPTGPRSGDGSGPE